MYLKNRNNKNDNNNGNDNNNYYIYTECFKKFLLNFTSVFLWLK